MQVIVMSTVTALFTCIKNTSIQAVLCSSQVQRVNMTHCHDSGNGMNARPHRSYLLPLVPYLNSQFSKESKKYYICWLPDYKALALHSASLESTYDVRWFTHTHNQSNRWPVIEETCANHAAAEIDERGLNVEQVARAASRRVRRRERRRAQERTRRRA